MERCSAFKQSLEFDSMRHKLVARRAHCASSRLQRLSKHVSSLVRHTQSGSLTDRQSYTEITYKHSNFIRDKVPVGRMDEWGVSWFKGANRQLGVYATQSVYQAYGKCKLSGCQRVSLCVRLCVLVYVPGSFVAAT